MAARPATRALAFWPEGPALADPGGITAPMLQQLSDLRNAGPGRPLLF